MKIKKNIYKYLIFLIIIIIFSGCNGNKNAKDDFMFCSSSAFFRLNSLVKYQNDSISEVLLKVKRNKVDSNDWSANFEIHAFSLIDTLKVKELFDAKNMFTSHTKSYMFFIKSKFHLFVLFPEGMGLDYEKSIRDNDDHEFTTNIDRGLLEFTTSFSEELVSNDNENIDNLFNSLSTRYNGDCNSVEP